MVADFAALVADLKALRKGLGVQDPRISAKIGPALRRVCGVPAADPPGVASKKVCARLEQLIDGLPEAQRGLARAAFGFDGTAKEHYTARLRAHGDRNERDVRTMQRWTDEIVDRIAELLDTDEPPPRWAESPWHTASLRVSLILDQPEVEVLEIRRIVSHRPGLAEIEHSMTVAPINGVTRPLDLTELGVNIFNGGDVQPIRQVARNRIAFNLRLPRILDTHDEHEFTLRVRVPRISPFYVCTPTFPCDHFDLCARFGRDRVPDRIWRVDGEFAMEADDPLPARMGLTADSSGEVRAEFNHLEPAKSYGIGWQ